MASKANRLGRIEEAVAAVRKAEEEVAAAVVAARTPDDPKAWWHPEVADWAEIGRALGVTRQGAAKKYGAACPKVRADRSYY